jgi:Protein of unknown function (DUF2783)
MTHATSLEASSAMPFEQFEQAYEALAEAIDQAGEKNEAVFLTKLILVMAHQNGNIDVFRTAIAMALHDVSLSSKMAL